MAFFSALGNFLKRPEDQYGNYYGQNQPVEQSRSGGIAPSPIAQDLLTRPLPIRPVPSYEPSPPTPPPPNQPKSIGEIGESAGIGAGKAFLGTAMSFLPEDLKPWVSAFNRAVLPQPAQEQVNAWMAPPSNKEEFAGGLGLDLLTPSDIPGMHMLPLLGGTLDDVAKRMGKPPGSLTSSFRKEIDRYGGTDYYQTRIHDRSPGAVNYLESSDPSVAGYIKFGSNPVDDHLSVSNTYMDATYHDKGLGGEMYQEALKGAKEAGFKGLASKPNMRNQFSNEIWDRPGVTRINPTTYDEYDLMSEYIPRGKDWSTGPFKNLFKQDAAEQPMLPEFKDWLLDQMKNRSFQSAGPRTAPLNVTQQSPTSESINDMIERIRRQVAEGKGQQSLYPFYDIPRNWK